MQYRNGNQQADQEEQIFHGRFCCEPTEAPGVQVRQRLPLGLEAQDDMKENYPEIEVRVGHDLLDPPPDAMHRTGQDCPWSGEDSASGLTL